MIRLCKYNHENILDKIRSGQLDAVALSTTNLIDDIILKINSCNIFNCLEKYIPDFRADNTTIPYKLIWASAIAAKMRVQPRHHANILIGAVERDDEVTIPSGDFVLRKGDKQIGRAHV